MKRLSKVVGGKTLSSVGSSGEISKRGWTVGVLQKSLDRVVFKMHRQS